jgi:transposase, IS5 family
MSPKCFASARAKSTRSTSRDQGVHCSDQEHRHHVGAKSFTKNLYDGHTLPEILAQVEDVTGKRPAFAICDRSTGVEMKISGTEILLPSRPKKTDTVYQRSKARQRFRRRS